jgi:hypothetical protein
MASLITAQGGWFCRLQPGNGCGKLMVENRYMDIRVGIR